MRPSDDLITKRLTVILCPPIKVASTDDIVEDKADDHIVDGRHRRQKVRASEDERKVDVLEKIDSELLVQHPLEPRCKDAGKEEDSEAVVKLTVREQALRPNDTPLHDTPQQSATETKTECPHDLL